MKWRANGKVPSNVSSACMPPIYCNSVQSGRRRLSKLEVTRKCALPDVTHPSQRPSEDSRMPRAVAVLRIFFGLVYFTNGLSKFVPGIAHLPGGYFLIDSEIAKSIIRHNAAHHPVGLYHDVVFDLFVPHWGVFGALLGL